MVVQARQKLSLLQWTEIINNKVNTYLVLKPFFLFKRYTTVLWDCWRLRKTNIILRWLFGLLYKLVLLKFLSCQLAASQNKLLVCQRYHILYNNAWSKQLPLFTLFVTYSYLFYVSLFQVCILWMLQLDLAISWIHFVEWTEHASASNDQYFMSLCIQHFCTVRCLASVGIQFEIPGSQ